MKLHTTSPNNNVKCQKCGTTNKDILSAKDVSCCKFCLTFQRYDISLVDNFVLMLSDVPQATINEKTYESITKTGSVCKVSDIDNKARRILYSHQMLYYFITELSLDCIAHKIRYFYTPTFKLESHQNNLFKKSIEKKLSSKDFYDSYLTHNIAKLDLCDMESILDTYSIPKF